MNNRKESLERMLRRARPDIDVSGVLDRLRETSSDYSRGASEFVVENAGKVILGASAAYLIARGIGRYLGKRKL